MSRAKKFLITIGIMIMVFPYPARVLRDIFDNYLTRLNELSGKVFWDAVDIRNFITFWNISHPMNALFFVIMAMYCIACFFNRLQDNTAGEYKKSDMYGSHGTSRWKTKKEVKKDHYKDKLGWFLGSTEPNVYTIDMDAAYLPVNGDLNMQLLVVGPPGSNKTTAFVLPNIFNLAYQYSKLDDERADMIIPDPKGELLELSAQYLIEKGYEVKVLDFMSFQVGDSLNPLDYISDDQTMTEISKGYIDSLYGSGNESASGEALFWKNQEYQVLCALIGFVKQTKDKKNQTFSSVVQALTSKEILGKNFMTYFSDNNIKGMPLQLWNNFLMICDSDNTRAGILGGLAEKLNLFSFDGVRNITAKTTLKIENLGVKKEKPIALFILMKYDDTTFAPIINVFLSIIFKQLYKTAASYNSVLPWPTYCFLEEFANIGKIPNILKMLGTMRQPRIYPMIIVQSLIQLKERYGDAWEDIQSQCDTHIYLGVNDNFTAEVCSKELGNTTIRIDGKSQSGNGIEINTSQNYVPRKLMMEDEVGRMHTRKTVIRQRSNFPMMLYKVQYRYKEYLLCEKFSKDKLPKLEYVQMPNITMFDSPKGNDSPKRISADEIEKFLG